MTDPADRLTARQRALVDTWLGEWCVLADHAWGQTDTVVLEVRSARGHVVVKAGGPANGHIGREIRAHQGWTARWVEAGRAARMVAADEDARVLVTTFVPGRLVEGTSAQDDPTTYLQAGRLLAAFHSQHAEVDPDWNDRLRQRVDNFLARPHRIDGEVEARVRRELEDWPGGGAAVVPTHGDWQPRNWLDDDGTLRVIDLGRFDLRPPEEDFVRLARQDFLRDQRLEVAFREGYGRDPREPGMWRRMNVAEAVGTAVWAFAVGDEPFEAVGHAQLARLFPTG